MSKLNKRTIIPAIGILFLLVVGGISYFNTYRGKVENSSLMKVKVAQFADVFLYLPLYIAKDKGFFEQEGLDVDIVSTGGDDKTYAAVIGGDAQFGIADPTFVAIASASGQGGQVVASVVNGVPFWGVAKKDSIPLITSPQLLKGYSVATFPAPSTAFVLQEQMFKKGGLEPNIRQSAFGTLLSQLDSNQVDIALELEPNVSMAVSRGARVVYSMPELYGDFAITGVSVSEKFAQSNPDQVQRFVNALELALRFARSNPDEVVEIALRRFPSVGKETARSALNRMIETRTLPVSTVISQEAWDKACQLRIDSGDLRARIDQARVSLNNGFAEKARNQ